MKQRTTVLLGAVVSALLLATSFGCDSAKKGEVPGSAKGRLQQTTQTLPSNTTFAYVMSDLAEFRKSAKAAKKTVNRLFPLDKAIDQARQSPAGEKLFGKEGLKLLKKDFWKKSGIAPDSAFVLGMVDFNTVVITYAADKKKFEKDLLKDLDADGKPKSGKVAGKKAKYVKTESGNVYWNYRGKLATVVFPEGDEAAKGDMKTPKPKKTLAKILKTKPKDSLAKTSGFKKYKKAAGDRPSLFYARLSQFMTEEEIKQAGNETSQKFARGIKNALDGTGVILKTEDNRIKARLWLGMTEEGSKQFNKMFESPVTGEWSKYVTADTLFGLRSSGNWKSMWESMLKSMPEKEKKQYKQGLKAGKKMTGLDIQKKLIDNLNGQSSLVVYGIGGKASPQMMSNPMSLLGKLEAAYVMKFGDAKALDEVTDKLAKMGSDFVSTRSLKADGKEVKSVKVMEVTPPKRGMMGAMLGGATGEDGEAPVRFYVHEDTVAMATTTISETNINQMLTGADGGEPITEAKNLDLGAKFAQAEQLSGLYINFDRFRSIFGDMLSKFPIASLKKAADTLEESLLSLESAENGAFLDLTVDLRPAGNSGK